MLLDPGTKGGAVFLSLLLFLAPLCFYAALRAFYPAADPMVLQRNIGAGFVLLSMALWVSSYLFRVGTKDMT